MMALRLSLDNLTGTGATFNGEIRDDSRLESYSLTIMRNHWEKLNRPVELFVSVVPVDPSKAKK